MGKIRKKDYYEKSGNRANAQNKKIIQSIFYEEVTFSKIFYGK